MKLKYLLVSLVVLGFAVGCDKKEATEKKESKWTIPSDSVCKSNGGEVKSYGCEATWSDAKKICSASGGRLATINELKKVVTDCGGEVTTDMVTISDKNVDNSSYQSCYKEKGFTSNYYWSSTTNARYTNFAWYVYFGNGVTGYYYKSGGNNVRCVRAGQ